MSRKRIKGINRFHTVSAILLCLIALVDCTIFNKYQIPPNVEQLEPSVKQQENDEPKNSTEKDGNTENVSYVGVGVVIEFRDETPTIFCTMSDSPAEKQGIIRGDRIIGINGELTSGMTQEQLLLKIRTANSPVNLDITRWMIDSSGETFACNITMILTPERIDYGKYRYVESLAPLFDSDAPLKQFGDRTWRKFISDEVNPYTGHSTHKGQELGLPEFVYSNPSAPMSESTPPNLKPEVFVSPNILNWGARYELTPEWLKSHISPTGKILNYEVVDTLVEAICVYKSIWATMEIHESKQEQVGVIHWAVNTWIPAYKTHVTAVKWKVHVNLLTDVYPWLTAEIINMIQDKVEKIQKVDYYYDCRPEPLPQPEPDYNFDYS